MKRQQQPIQESLVDARGLSSEIAASPHPPGAWKVQAGTAMTLCPRSDGVVTVVRGGLWATRSGPHGAAPVDSGDIFLGVGGILHIRRNEKVVIESLKPGESCYFHWDPAPVPSIGARLRRQLAWRMLLKPHRALALPVSARSHWRIHLAARCRRALEVFSGCLPARMLKRREPHDRAEES